MHPPFPDQAISYFLQRQGESDPCQSVRLIPISKSSATISKGDLCKLVAKQKEEKCQEWSKLRFGKQKKN